MPTAGPRYTETNHEHHSRRAFLITSATLLAATLPTLGDSRTALAQEPTAQNSLDRNQRLALLQTISATIGTSADSNQRITQMTPVRELVNKYRQAMISAQDLDVTELTRATDVVRIKINMTYYSSGIEPQVAEQFLKECALDFYRELHAKLTDLKTKNSEDTAKIESTLSSIQSDVYWSAAHRLPGIARDCGALVSDLYINPAQCTCISEIYSQMKFPADQYQFHLAVIERCEKYLPDLIKKTIDDAVSRGGSTAQRSGEHLFQFVLLTRQAIACAAACDSFPKSQAIVLKERMALHCEMPLFERLVPLYTASTRERGEQIESGLTSFVPQQILRAFLKDSSHLVRLMQKFVSGLDGSREELGNRFMESYRQEAAHRGPFELNRLKLTPLLLNLAPEPARKDPIALDIRTLLTSDPTGQNSASTISALLGVLLLSDHTYEASTLNPKIDISAAVRTTSRLMTSIDTPPPLNAAITPGQLLLIDLSRAANYPEGGIARTPNNKFPSSELQSLSDLAFHSMLQLALDIYKLIPPSVFRDKSDQDMSVIVTPDGWGPRPELSVKSDRHEESFAALQNFTHLADSITSNFAHFFMRERSEEAIVDRLVLLAKLFEERDSIRGIGGISHAAPIAVIKEQFAYLSERSETGPYAEVLQKARTMLYLARHGRPAPIFPREEGLRINSQRDPEIEKLALNYAKTAEEHCIYTFIAKLWHSDTKRENRPLESHQVLSAARMAGELQQILNNFGLYESHDSLRRLFEQDGTVNLEKITRHIGKLEAEQDQLIEQIRSIASGK